MEITQDRLKEVLTYTPETGVFYWAKKTCAKVVVGKEAGCVGKTHGYVVIGIDGHIYPAHRLVWLYVFGRFPPNYLDHINGARTDNRLENLRECTHADNQKNAKRPANNSSGFKGVHFHRQSGKWRARIAADNKHYSAGLHDTPEEAHMAYRLAAAKLHGNFARFE